MQPLIEVSNLHFRYGSSNRKKSALPWTLTDLNFVVEKSSSLGVVGESGSGKSTLIRLLCGLLPIGEGSIQLEGRNIHDWLDTSRADFRRRNQFVFQNPRRSLDPRMRVQRSLSEPIRALEERTPDENELRQLLADVGLGPEILPRFPHQLSGGQLQRIALARVLSVKPSILYADEPTSALDVSVQAQVLNLLMDLVDRFELSLIMVSHDLAVVSRVAENLIVLKDGVIVEAGETQEILANPSHPYTASLVRAAQAVSR